MICMYVIFVCGISVSVSAEMATCTALTAIELACQMDKIKVLPSSKTYFFYFFMSSKRSLKTIFKLQVSLRRKDKQLVAATEKVL